MPSRRTMTAARRRRCLARFRCAAENTRQKGRPYSPVSTGSLLPHHRLTLAGAGLMLAAAPATLLYRRPGRNFRIYSIPQDRD